ncbi:MAG: transglutaminase-like cysteine peptidase [Xanthobacteraceae bacterium]
MLPHVYYRLAAAMASVVLVAACSSTTSRVAQVQFVQPTPVARQTIFSSQVVYSTNVAFFTRWTGVETQFAAQQQPGACTTEADGSCAQTQWLALIDDLKSRPLADRVEYANEYLNAVRYVPAIKNWGSPAYWETPFEFLTRGGQCQDYAISKYLALRASGVPDSAMRVVIVHDRRTSQDHAILIVTVDSRDLVLDNMTTTVDPIENVRRYRAYYAINNSGWWAYFDPTTRFAGTQIAAVQ